MPGCQKMPQVFAFVYWILQIVADFDRAAGDANILIPRTSCLQAIEAIPVMRVVHLGG
jgi:hypothetical protein